MQITRCRSKHRIPALNDTHHNVRAFQRGKPMFSQLSSYSRKERNAIQMYAFPKVVLGKTDLFVSRLCLGTMMMGSGNSASEGHTLLDKAFELGINFFDTAEMYPIPQEMKTQGDSERILGSWLKTKGRENVVIATKVTGPSGQMPWIRGGPLALSFQDIQDAVDGSLRRLGTDCIDLYQIHWPDRYVPMFGEEHYDCTRCHSFVPFEEQLSSLEKSIIEGKIRYVGLSNETPWGLLKFQTIAQAAGLPIASLQNSYSLLCRSFDHALSECCHMEGISLLAYSPLAMGILTGKYTGPEGPPQSSRLIKYKGRYSEGESRYSLSNQSMIKAVLLYSKVAEEHGMSLTELALRFVLQNPLVAAAVVGASDQTQLEALISAARHGPLAAEITDRINEVHHMYPNPNP